jgi:hypothetical protein
VPTALDHAPDVRAPGAFVYIRANPRLTLVLAPVWRAGPSTWFVRFGDDGYFHGDNGHFTREATSG